MPEKVVKRGRALDPASRAGKAETMITVRVDSTRFPGLHDAFGQLCHKENVAMNTALVEFMQRCVHQEGLPGPFISRPKAEVENIPGK